MNNRPLVAAQPVNPQTPVSQAMVPLAGTAIAFITLITVGVIGGAGVAMTMLMQ
jgi:hypothetical protein